VLLLCSGMYAELQSQVVELCRGVKFAGRVFFLGAVCRTRAGTRVACGGPLAAYVTEGSIQIQILCSESPVILDLATLPWRYYAHS
jgi:hypothetical protein